MENKAMKKALLKLRNNIDELIEEIGGSVGKAVEDQEEVTDVKAGKKKKSEAVELDAKTAKKLAKADFENMPRTDLKALAEECGLEITGKNGSTIKAELEALRGDDDEDEEEEEKPKKKSKKVVEEDDDEDEKPTKKSKSKKDDDEDEDDEDEKPAKKKKKADDDDEDEEETPSSKEMKADLEIFFGANKEELTKIKFFRKVDLDDEDYDEDKPTKVHIMADKDLVKQYWLDNVKDEKANAKSWKKMVAAASEDEDDD